MTAVFVIILGLMIVDCTAEPTRGILEKNPMLKLKISNRESFILPPPASRSSEGRLHERQCRISIDGLRQFIHCEPLPSGVLGLGNSAYETSLRVEAIVLEKIQSVKDLARFMISEKVAGLPRYAEKSEDKLLSKLQKIEVKTSFGFVYELSGAELDLREPDSPDIFIRFGLEPKLLWLKDAGHLKLDWTKAKVQSL